MHNIFSSFFKKSSFAAPPNGFAAERFSPGFRQYCNFVSLIRYCTERRCMLKRRYRAAHAVNQKEPHPCGSGPYTGTVLTGQLERAPSVRIGLFVLRTSVMRSALCIYVYLLFL